MSERHCAGPTPEARRPRRAGPPHTVDTNELIQRWQEERDPVARQELCVRYLPLVHKLAGRYRNSHDPFEDLVQVASVGLLGAIDRFDPARGASFGAFAVPTVLGELKRYFRNTGWSVHVPRGAQELALRVDRASREIAARAGRSPRVDELARYLELSPEDVLTGLDAGTAHYSDSLDAPAAGGDPEESRSLVETLGVEDDRYGLVDVRLSLEAAIGRLPHLERQALTLRVAHGCRQIEIAREMGCSQMQVSRLLRRAAATVRELTDPALAISAAGTIAGP